MKRAMLFLSLAAALVACKSKSKPSDQPGSASGSGSAVAADAAPAKNTVTVPAGPAKLGCIGWNAATKTVACITGETSAGEAPQYRIDYVGSSEPATKLALKDDAIADTAAANATLAKLGMEALPGTAQKIAGPKPGDWDLGNGATIVWADKIKDEGGENQAPTTHHEVSVTCANKQTVELENVEQEGLDVELHVWQVPGHLVIEHATRIGREGESREMRSASLLELATCKLVRGER